MKCAHRFQNGKRSCGEPALPNSTYCILHHELPKNKNSDDYKRIIKLKEDKIEEKIYQKNFNFEGAKLLSVDLSKLKIDGDINFNDSIIEKFAWFNGSEINGSIRFERAIVCKEYPEDDDLQESISFMNSFILKDAYFLKFKTKGDLNFIDASIGGALHLSESEFGACWLYGVEMGKYPWFVGSKIESSIMLDGSHIGVIINYNPINYFEKPIFDDIKIGGQLSLKETKFGDYKTQEYAFRKSKLVYSKMGNREEEDYYFYKEMEAKRLQKKHLQRIMEWPIQYIFRYGTEWGIPLTVWILVSFSLGLIFWALDGIDGASCPLQNVYFSFATSFKLSNTYLPNSNAFLIITTLESIFGTFMWGAFIAIFARKYMR